MLILPCLSTVLYPDLLVSDPPIPSFPIQARPLSTNQSYLDMFFLGLLCLPLKVNDQEHSLELSQFRLFSSPLSFKVTPVYCGNKVSISLGLLCCHTAAYPSDPSYLTPKERRVCGTNPFRDFASVSLFGPREWLVSQ